MNVWSYWEGPMPPHIETCIASMRRVCGDDFHLVTPANLRDYVPHGALHPNYRTMPQLGPKVSAIRAALLALHGGWWLDADTVALRHPQEVNLSYPHADVLYSMWSTKPERCLNGYIYARKHSLPACEWLRRVNYKLEYAYKRACTWLVLGEKVLTELMLGDERCQRIPLATFLPLEVDTRVAEFFEDRKPAEYIKPETVCFGLNHSWMMHHHARDMALPRAQWPNSPMLIHRLLAKACRSQ